MVKIEWDLDDYVFICVSAVALFWFPILMYFNISSEEVTDTFLSYFMKTPFYGDYLSYNFDF